MAELGNYGIEVHANGESILPRTFRFNALPSRVAHTQQTKNELEHLIKSVSTKPNGQKE